MLLLKVTTVETFLKLYVFQVNMITNSDSALVAKIDEFEESRIKSRIRDQEFGYIVSKEPFPVYNVAGSTVFFKDGHLVSDDKSLFTRSHMLKDDVSLPWKIKKNKPDFMKDVIYESKIWVSEDLPEIRKEEEKTIKHALSLNTPLYEDKGEGTTEIHAKDDLTVMMRTYRTSNRLYEDEAGEPGLISETIVSGYKPLSKADQEALTDADIHKTNNTRR